MIEILMSLMLLAQTPEERPIRLLCTTVGGPIDIGPYGANVTMKCCPTGSFIDDPNHPVDDKGNLICYRGKT
jgi:hypothetical protein